MNKYARIGYDAKRIVRNGTGLGSYGRTLINDLAPLLPQTQLRLYAPDDGKAVLREQVLPAENVTFVYPSHLHLRLQRDLWRMHGVVKRLQQDGVSLYHGLSGELPFGLKKAGIAGIVTVHDLIFLRHPEFYPAIDAFIYKLKFYQMLQEATRIVAISACTRRDILHYSNFPTEKIDLVYQSCGSYFSQSVGEDALAEARQRYQLPARYLLNVGTVEVRKNILLGIEALPFLPQDMHLVVVGRKTSYQKKLDSAIQSLGIGDRVHFIQGIPNNLLPAIQSGLPVVAAKGSCLEEAGGPDSLYVDADDAKGLAEAVEKAMQNRTEMVEKSRQYVKRFENQNVAEQIISCYERI